jgi:hypothetical protein
MGLEQRASNAAQETELDQFVASIEQVAKGAQNARVRDVAKCALEQAESRRPFLRNTRIFFQLSPVAQFGLVGIDDTRKPRSLTYSTYGDTNLTTLRIDGERVVFGSAKGEWVSRRSPLEMGPNGAKRLGIKSEWLYRPKFLRVTQILELVPGNKAGPDTCLVAYLISNTGKEKLTVSLNAEIDTMIDKSDGNPFAIPKQPGEKSELITRTRTFAPPKSQIPPFVEAFSPQDPKAPDPDRPAYAAYFSLRLGGGLEPPTRFVIQNLRGLRDADSPDYAPTEGVPLTDSAVSIYWGPRVIAPQSSRAVAYAYGLGRVELQRLSPPPLILELAKQKPTAEKGKRAPG